MFPQEALVVNKVLKAREAPKDPEALAVRPVMMELMGDLALLVRAGLVVVEAKPAQEAALGRRARPVIKALKALLDPRDPPVRMASRDPTGAPVLQAPPDLQAQMEIKVLRGPGARPDGMAGPGNAAGREPPAPVGRSAPSATAGQKALKDRLVTLDVPGRRDREAARALRVPQAAPAPEAPPA